MHENPKSLLCMAMQAIKGAPVAPGDMVYETKWSAGNYTSTLTIPLLGAEQNYVGDPFPVKAQAERSAADKAMQANKKRSGFGFNNNKGAGKGFKGAGRGQPMYPATVGIPGMVGGAFYQPQLMF